MKFSYLTAVATALAPVVSASMFAANSTGKGPDKDGKYWIQSDDLKLGFVALGGAVSNVFFKDQYGTMRDLVGGYDNASYYTTDKLHPHFGAVPGRYANRIKNSTFTIDGKKYNIKPNENPTKDHPKGVDTLHGGPDGWDYHNFTVVAHTDSSLTFMYVDPDGKEGFPGEVVAYITYTVEEADWHIKMVALATTKKTPIMLSSHAYWNLDGFANNETDNALNHTLHMPYSGQRVGVDNILIPNGDILPNKNGSVNDFWSKPKQIGASMDDPDLVNNCGFNCTGYDTCFTVNREQLGSYDWRTSGPVVTLASKWSGIQLDVHTDQVAFQVYSCNAPGLNIKKTQGSDKFKGRTSEYACVVLEPEDYIDGINNPAWFRTDKQIYGPGDDPYVFQARYSFSIMDKKNDTKSDDDA